MTSSQPSVAEPMLRPTFGPRLAALVALLLGALAAAAWVGGEHRWDGRVVLTLAHDHGVHIGDSVAILPLLLGIGLAQWCWRQRAKPPPAAAVATTDPGRVVGP